MLEAQRAHITEMAEAITSQIDQRPGDVVALWRSESSNAALRFLERLADPPNRATGVNFSAEIVSISGTEDARKHSQRGVASS